MADFVLGVNLQIQNVLGLQAVRQQLSGVTSQLSGQGGIGNLGTQINALNQSLGQASTAFRNFGNTVGSGGQNIRNAGRNIAGTTKAADSFGESVFVAGRRYAAFIAATSIAFRAVDLITEGTRAVLEFDEALIKLRQILGVDADLVEDLSTQILDLATSTGTSIEDVSSLGRILAQAGLRGDELTTSLDALAKVPLTPTFENIQNATEGVLASINQFGEDAGTASDVLDRFTAVANNFAVTAEDLAIGVSRGGAAFRAIGGTLDEFVGAFAAVRQVTRESEATIGTFFKTLSSRLATSDIREFLQGRGISLVDQTGNFVGPIRALERIGEALENITTVQDKVEIANRVAGRRQVSRFLALINNLDLVGEAIDTAADSTGEFDRVASQGLESINAQLSILGQTARRLAIELGEDLFIPVIRGLTAFGEAAITAVDAIKPLVPVLASLAGLFATGALARGFSTFVAPRLGAIGSVAAGGAAAGAARAAGRGRGGAGLAGATGFLGSSPLAQAGLISIASSGLTQLSRSLLDADDGIDGFTTSLVQATGVIASAALLFRNQTLAQLFSRDAGGRVAGGARSVAALAVGFAGFQVADRARQLADDAVQAAVQAIDNIEIDVGRINAQDTTALQDGIRSAAEQVNQAVADRISQLDPTQADTAVDAIGRTLGAGVEAVNQIIRGNFEALTRRGAISDSQINQIINDAFSESPRFIQQLGEGVSRILADQADELQSEDDVVRARAIALRRVSREALGDEGGVQFANALLSNEQALGRFEQSVNQATIATQLEADAATSFAAAVFPDRLTVSLFELTRAASEAARSLEGTARIFDTQLQLVEGIGAPGVSDIQFDPREIQRATAAGQFGTILGDRPEIQEFARNAELVQSAFDAFVEEIGGVDPQFIGERGPASIAGDFLSAVDVPEQFRGRLQEFLTEIASGFAQERIIPPEELQRRFDETFGDIRTGADAVTAALQDAIRGIFAGIDDELNRTTNLRQRELEAAITPQAQAQFIQQQLQRAGIQGPRLTPQRNIPEFATTAQDLQREQQRRLEDETLLRRFTGGDRIGGQGVLRQPGLAELRGPRQNIAQLALDEDLRGRVGQQLIGLVEELTQARVRLEELSASGEGSTQTFFEAAQEIRDLNGRIIETQAAFQALTQATQSQRQEELQSIRVRQAAELDAFRTRTLQRAQPTELGQVRARRQIEDFQTGQARELEAAARTFDELLQSDAQLRVELTRTINANTPRQEEAAALLNRGAVIFAEAVERFRDIRDADPQQNNEEVVGALNTLTEAITQESTVRIETDQNVNVSVQGVAGEIEATIRPLLEQAGNDTARVAVISVLRSLAEKTDAETATAIQQTIGELE